VTPSKVIEENGRSATAPEEGGCECGCGMGVARETEAETRESGQPGATSEATYGMLEEPYGCCGAQRFS
jgi:hypothetical protein